MDDLLMGAVGFGVLMLIFAFGLEALVVLGLLLLVLALGVGAINATHNLLRRGR